MSVDLPTEPNFKVIREFLDLFDVSVVGHGREELRESDKARIEALARGELTPAQRLELVPLLSRNEVAIEYLASLAKAESTGDETP